MENNSQTKFSRHSMMSEIIKGKRISKETQERKQFRGTPQRCKRGEDTTITYNLVLFYLFSTTLRGRIERYVFLHHKESGFLFSKPHGLLPLESVQVTPTNLRSVYTYCTPYVKIMGQRGKIRASAR